MNNVLVGQTDRQVDLQTETDGRTDRHIDTQTDSIM